MIQFINMKMINIFNLIKYISIFLLILGSPPTYSQNSATTEEFEMIVDEIEKLTIIIEEMEQVKKEYKDEKSINRVQTKIGILKDELFEISGILEDVEKKSLMDIMEMGAELRTRCDWFTFKGHDNFPYTDEKIYPGVYEKVHMLPSNRFRINMKAQLTDNLLFRSRLVMHHIWADDDEPLYPEANFLNKARIPSNINLKVERAYVDYFFELTEKFPMAISFGRIPTTDGLPTDLRDNTPRKSTYPGLAYDVESDGVALSVMLEKLTHIPRLAFRLGGMLRYDDNQQYAEGNIISEKKGIFREDFQAMDIIEIYIAQLETGLPYFFGGSLIVLNLLFIPDAACLDLRYDKNLYPFYYNEKNIVYPETPDSLGRLTKLTFFMESKEFFGYYFDWFLGLGYVKTKAKGALKFMFNPQALGIPEEPVLARDAYKNLINYISLNPSLEPLLKDLRNVSPPIGLLNNDGTSDREAFAFHVGFRFNIPSELLNIPKIGVEYNQGSKHWFGASMGSEDPLHKLDTRGRVWDLYYVQPFNKFFSIRLGYTMSWHDYTSATNFYYGGAMGVDHKIGNIYFLMDARL